MSHSSILNFESFEGFAPRLPKTLLCVVAIVGAIELFMRLIPEESLIPVSSRQGEIAFMEKTVLPKFDNPQIVLLGSSRIRRAVVPKLLDRELGLPENSTVNLGLASGRIFEALYLFERNLPKLGRAHLVILNIDEWQLSSGWRLGSLYEMHAPMAERWQLRDQLGEKLVLDEIFTMRHKLRLLPSALSRHFSKSRRHADQVDLTFDANNQVLPPARKEKIITDPHDYDELIQGFYDRFHIHPVMLGHIETLARHVRESGGRLVLMQLPNRRLYQQEVLALKAEDYREHVRALKALANRLNVPLCLREDPADCGLNEDSYEDYGHITPPGAQIFTRWLAKLIQEDKLFQK